MAIRDRTVHRLLSRLSRSIATRTSNEAVPQVTAQVTAQVSAQVSERIGESLRAEMVEVARMLRQQGDAADEVAETLGRTLARLSAEVDHLAEAVARLSDAAPDPERPGPTDVGPSADQPAGIGR